MILTEHTTPLSRDELTELEALLDSERFGGEAMPLDALQGLFFALASSPEEIPPSQWLPAVFGEGHEFDDGDDASGSLALVMRFCDQTLRAAAGEDFELILYTTETGDVDYASWCDGYLVGVDLAPTDWYELGDPDEVDELLFPLLVLADAVPEEEKRTIGAAEWERLVRSSGETIADSLSRIHAYWQVVRTPPETVRRSTPKVGRNDPCPCGSGKKYKQCCGAN